MTKGRNSGTSKSAEKFATKISSSYVRSIGIYGTCYYPVERKLRMMSMLYRFVESEVFS